MNGSDEKVLVHLEKKMQNSFVSYWYVFVKDDK